MDIILICDILLLYVILFYTYYYIVKFSLENDGTMTTEGGALGSKYEVLQFHLHWGSNNRKGSEHLVDGKPYPMEVRTFLNIALYFKIQQ